MLRFCPAYARGARPLGEPVGLGQLDRGNEGIERAGLAGRAHVANRACPEHAVLVVTAGVVSLNGLSLPAEKGVELRCPGGDRENLEVPDEDALERLSVGVEPGLTASLLARLGQH